MSLIAIDSSFTLAWCFEDEVNDRAERLLSEVENHELVTLPLWRWEVANALLIAQRRKRFPAEKLAVQIDSLQRLHIRYDDNWMFDLAELVALSQKHTLTVYDAAYLELAQRLGASLATLDEALERAARASGITVV